MCRTIVKNKQNKNDTEYNQSKCEMNKFRVSENVARKCTVTSLFFSTTNENKPLGNIQFNV